MATISGFPLRINFNISATHLYYHVTMLLCKEKAVHKVRRKKEKAYSDGKTVE